MSKIRPLSRREPPESAPCMVKLMASIPTINEITFFTVTVIIGFQCKSIIRKFHEFFRNIKVSLIITRLITP